MKYSTKKQKIVKFDITESLPHMWWKNQAIKYKFIASRKKKESETNIINMDVSSDDD